MSNDITELRNHLFDTLRGVKDGSVDIDRARAVNEVATVIIQTAKVEVDYVRATGAEPATSFIAPVKPAAQMPKLDRTLAGSLKEVHQ